MADSDDDVSLRPETLAILQAFLSEKRAAEEAAAKEADDTSVALKTTEDWQMSQFWYSEETSAFLAEATLRAARAARPEGGAVVACVSCPSTFKALVALGFDEAAVSVLRLLEYDRRFAVFGERFAFFDFNAPEAVPEELRGACDVIVLDPPFLQADCLQAFAAAVALMQKGPATRVILCTGAVMLPHAARFLSLRPTRASIKHAGGRLSNPFAMFASHEDVAEGAGGWDAEAEEAYEREAAAEAERGAAAEAAGAAAGGGSAGSGCSGTSEGSAGAAAAVRVSAGAGAAAAAAVGASEAGAASDAAER